MKTLNLPTLAVSASSTHPATPKVSHRLRMIFGLALALLGLSAPIATAGTIFVQNPSFETPGDINSTYWAKINSDYWIQGNAANAFCQQDIPLANTTDAGAFSTIPHGNYAVNLNGCGFSVTQNLNITVNSGDTLSVTFWGGRHKTQTGGPITATFTVGSTTYSQDFDTSALAANSWQQFTFTKTITNSGNLTLAFARSSAKTSGRPWLDDVSNVIWTTSEGGTPTITTSGPLSSAVSSTTGTASSPVTFMVAGANMTAGILVTAPTGFEVSQSSDSGYGTTTTVGAPGTIAATTVYVRLAATAAFGTYNSQNIVLSSMGATAVNVTTAASGNNMSSSSAVVTLAGTLGAVNTTYGTASASPTSFHVSGSGLLDNLTVTPPAGYEVSLIRDVWDYTTSLLITASGTLASTQVYVRLAATTAVNRGTPYTGNITVAGGGSFIPQTITTASSTVAPADLTITALDRTKPYNTVEPTQETETTWFSVNGLQNDDAVDTVTLDLSAGALNYTDVVGSTSTITPRAAAGTFNAGNYNITYLPGTLTVEKATPWATLTLSNSTVTYDGSAHAAIVDITDSLVPGTVQNIRIGGAADQTNGGSYAVTADFVPDDTTNYNTLTALSVGNFTIEDNNNYAAWATANSVTGGISGDSNNDGIQNGVAYFMGVTGQATNPGLDADNVVTWSVNPGYRGTFEVQTSSDLSTWTRANPQPTPADGKLIYPLPLNTPEPKRFVRLLVTPN